MYKKILVPLDGSKRAEMILPHVEELAGRYLATVIFLIVIEYKFTAGIEGAYIEASGKDFDRQTKQADTYLEGIAGEFRNKKITAETRIVHGPVVASILETADKEHADLIAMTSHGRGAISRVFYGSVAAGVLNRVDRPLLIVRSRNTK